MDSSQPCVWQWLFVVLSILHTCLGSKALCHGRHVAVTLGSRLPFSRHYQENFVCAAYAASLVQQLGRIAEAVQRSLITVAEVDVASLVGAKKATVVRQFDAGFCGPMPYAGPELAVCKPWFFDFKLRSLAMLCSHTRSIQPTHATF